jgi:hypothetical protein
MDLWNLFKWIFVPVAIIAAGSQGAETLLISSGIVVFYLAVVWLFFPDSHAAPASE